MIDDFTIPTVLLLGGVGLPPVWRRVVADYSTWQWEPTQEDLDG